MLAQKPWLVPIPGTTPMGHLSENIGAADVRFTADKLEQFDAELGEIEFKGERLPSFVQALSGVEAPVKKS